MTHHPSEPVPLRRQLYALLIVLAVAVTCSRIVSATQLFEPYLYHDQPTGKDDPATGLRAWPAARPRPVPTFGSNDRSRWATIRALVDDGTYAIGAREDTNPADATTPYQDSGIITEDGWKSVDKVLVPREYPEGSHTYWFYSSKPPLLPTLLAGEYWLLKQAFGLSLENPDEVWVIVRILLLTVNALPLAIYLILLARLVERHGASDWGRLFVLAAACFGTFLTLFAITLNNHLLAACFAFYSLYAALHIWRNPQSGAGWYALTGLLASFTAAIELPALALTGLLFLLLLLRSWRRTLLGFVPAGLVIVAAALVTNYLALGTVLPAYSEMDRSGPDTGFWYKYKGSVWRNDYDGPKKGPDFAYLVEAPEVYAMHFLVGHHGVFSLTPLWLLSLAGMLYGVSRLGRNSKAQIPNSRSDPAPTPPREPEFVAPPPEPAPPPVGEEESPFRFDQSVPPKPEEVKAPEASPPPPAPEPAPTVKAPEPVTIELPEMPLIAALTLVLTVVVIGFYLWKTNNYSGWSNGLRWLFWLIPFWLVTCLPVLDWLSTRRWGRGLALVLLAVSVFSATYRDWNAWRHPWIWQLLDWQGWLPY